MQVSATINRLGALGMLVGDAVQAALGDLSESAASMLSTLHYYPNLTATAIAEIVGVSQPTTTRVLGGLARRGWIERQEREGRETPLRLTKAGAARASALQSERRAALERLATVLSSEDRRTFWRLVDQILAEATTSRASARTTCRLCDHASCTGARCPVGSRATRLETRGTRPRRGHNAG